MTHAAIIILAWNGTNYLPACLEAVLAQDGPPAEVIVVDNASTDDSREIVRRYAPRVRLIENTHNLGFAGGNNVGLAATEAEVVILLNQDTVVRPGWLKAMLATFALDDRIGIVGCKALYPDGRIQHAGGWVNTTTAFTGHFGQGEADLGQYDDLRDVDYVTGASMAIHRKVLSRIGLLDVKFNPAYYEETDFCFRARRHGFRVVYQPLSTLIHYEQTTLGDTSKYKYRSVVFHTNRVRFLLKHWSDSQLMSYMAEEPKIIENFVGENIDAIARARAYFRNAVDWTEICSFRKENIDENGRLNADEVLQFLLILRLMAFKKLHKIIVNAPAANELKNNTLANYFSDEQKSDDISETRVVETSVTPALVADDRQENNISSGIYGLRTSLDFIKNSRTKRAKAKKKRRFISASTYFRRSLLTSVSESDSGSPTVDDSLSFFLEKADKIKSLIERKYLSAEGSEKIPTSPVPFVGRVVDFFRKIFINTIIRPYVVPVFEQQWSYNKSLVAMLSEILDYTKSIASYYAELRIENRLRTIEKNFGGRLLDLEKRQEFFGGRLLDLEKRQEFFEEAIEIVAISDEDLVKRWSST